MGHIDINAISLAIIRIQRVPLLGRILRYTRLSSGTSAVILFIMAIIIFLTPNAIDPAYRDNAIFLALWMFTCLLSLTLLLAFWGVIKLNRLTSQYSLGSYHNWLDCIFDPSNHIPMMFPEFFLNRIAAVCAFLLAGFLTIMLVFVFPLALYKFADACLQMYVAYLISTSDPELIGRIAGHFIGIFFCLVFLFVVQNFTWRTYRRLTSVPTAKALKSDQRKPILLLRSFCDDNIKFKRGFFGTKRYFEENLAVKLWHEGPVIAIGKPKEFLPSYGACREYHTDETWQNRVLELLEKSRAVLFLVGLTDALDWEINQLREQQKLHKSLFLIPPLPNKEISKRLKKFSVQLPEFSSTLSQKQNSFQQILCIALDSNKKPIYFTSHNRTPLDYSVAIHAAFYRLNI